MDNYFNRYIKYKNKYLKLKKLLGGTEEVSRTAFDRICDEMDVIDRDLMFYFFKVWTGLQSVTSWGIDKVYIKSNEENKCRDIFDCEVFPSNYITIQSIDNSNIKINKNLIDRINENQYNYLSYDENNNIIIIDYLGYSIHYNIKNKKLCLYHNNNYIRFRTNNKNLSLIPNEIIDELIKEEYHSDYYVNFLNDEWNSELFKEYRNIYYLNNDKTKKMDALTKQIIKLKRSREEQNQDPNIKETVRPRKEKQEEQKGGECYKKSDKRGEKCYDEELLDRFDINKKIYNSYVDKYFKVVFFNETYNIHNNHFNIIFEEDLGNNKFRLYIICSFGSVMNFDNIEYLKSTDEYKELFTKFVNYMLDINCENICLMGHSAGSLMVNLMGLEFIKFINNFNRISHQERINIKNKLYILSSAGSCWLQNQEDLDLFNNELKGRYLMFMAKEFDMYDIYCYFNCNIDQHYKDNLVPLVNNLQIDFVVVENESDNILVSKLNNGELNEILNESFENYYDNPKQNIIHIFHEWSNYKSIFNIIINNHKQIQQTGGEEIKNSSIILICDNSILFTYDYNKNYWVTPGGNCEENEHPRFTAFREFLEEIGYISKSESTQNIQSYSSKIFNGNEQSNYINNKTCIYVYEINDKSKIPEFKFNDEMDMMLWVNIDFLKDNDFTIVTNHLNSIDERNNKIIDYVSNSLKKYFKE